VAEAFTRFAGWDPVAAFDADRFDRDLTEKVEPQLPREVPVVLSDYPAERAALARCRPDQPPVAERWELYLDGLEIANAYSELTDPEEHRRRFAEWAQKRRAHGRDVYPPDEAFMAALDAGLPPSAGIALGVDRLLMVLTDAHSLDDILPFRGDEDKEPDQQPS
jgi:lysyl-tRNA synthetase class 2